MIDLAVHDFESAGRAVLAFLKKRFAYDLWLVTRVEGDDWIVLQSEDCRYGVTAGRVFNWADSLCYEMVMGNAPRFAPDSTCVPEYKNAPIAQEFKIGAYVGMPLKKADGSLFGTLCAIDPVRQPEVSKEDQELFELFAALLSKILQSDLRANDALRRSERFEVEAHTDFMTKLYNRRAWDELLIREEERCRRYGHTAAVIIIDLDGLKHVNDTFGHAAGDELLIRAANALRNAAREIDVVARLGGDEFAILAIECDLEAAKSIAQRVRRALLEANVNASVGMAMRPHGGGLSEATRTADERMYQEKHTH